MVGLIEGKAVKLLMERQTWCRSVRASLGIKKLSF